MVHDIDIANLREVIKAAKKNPPIQASLQNILRVVLAYEDLAEAHERRGALMHRYCDAVDNGRIKSTATYKTFCQELKRPFLRQPERIEPRETNGNYHASGSF